MPDGPDFNPDRIRLLLEIGAPICLGIARKLFTINSLISFTSNVRLGNRFAL